jgi:ribose-phosphate pyrophosphokinase
MKLLSLSNPEKSDIQFKVSKFPDGQQSVSIETDSLVANGMYLTDDHIVIESRFNSFRDLELIISANQAIREMGIPNVDLVVPYFLGARSDRKFTEGTSNYLKTVVCPIINSQNFNQVVVLDPHSDVLEACLNNFIKIDNVQVVAFALEKIGKENVVLVSPDAGALKKVYHVAESLELEDIVIASKHRDVKTGKITHTEVPGLEKYDENHKFVIVDDICDGGRTFTELAKAIRKHNALSEIYLIVTHGIFSAGMAPLNEAFTGIFTTNSIRPENDEIFNTENDTTHLFIQPIL